MAAAGGEPPGTPESVSYRGRCRGDARCILIGLTITYAGTTGVLLAFDVVPERRKGLLGFAIERDGGNRPHRWLQGMLHFPGQKHEPGQPIDSNVASPSSASAAE